MSKYILIAVAVVLSSGCAGVDRHEAGLGFSSDGDDHMLSAHYSEHKRDGVGFLVSLGAGGSGPKGKDFDDNTSPFVPGPGSILSTKKDDAMHAVNLKLAATYMVGNNLSLYAGPSVRIGQTYEQYDYNTPFSGDGSYYVEDGSLDFKLGAVFGAKYFIDGENASIGIEYDTSIDMIGVNLGFSF